MITIDRVIIQHFVSLYRLFLAAIVGVITITTLYDLMMIETELGTSEILV